MLAAMFFYGVLLWLAVHPDPYPAPLFAHFFWRSRKSGSPKARLWPCRINGSPVNPDKRADVHPQGVGRIRSAPSSLTAALAIGPYKRLQKTNRADNSVRPYRMQCMNETGRVFPK